MGRLFKKALLYKEWRLARWFIPLLLFELIYFYIINPEINPDGVKVINAIFLGTSFDTATVVVIITIALMASLLMYYDRKPSTYTFTATLPFHRSDVIKTKWLVGVAAILISSAVIQAMMLVLLVLERQVMSAGEFGINLHILMNWFWLNLSMNLAIFSFLLFAQCLSGSWVFGSINGTLLLYFPNLITAGVRNSAGDELQLGPKIFIHKIDRFLNLPSYGYIANRDDLWIGDRLLAAVMMIIVFYYLTIAAYRKNSFEKVNHLFIFAPLIEFYYLFAAIYLSFVMLIRLDTGNLLPETIRSDYFKLLEIMTVLFIPIYLAVRKMFRMGERYFAKDGLKCNRF